MKAAVYDNPGPPTVLRYADVPDPVAGPNDVLIAVKAISIEGGDLIKPRTTQQPSPWIVGYAAAGTILSIGESVRDRWVGQRVTAFDMQGSHAELWSVPATRTWLVPDGVDMEQAAALPVSFGTAYHCLFTRGHLRESETVLIQAAAGGVGLAAIQLAREAGATVFAVTSGRERQARLVGLGASHVIDRLENGVVAEVLRRTDGRGADLVVDPVGSTLQDSLSALAPEGRLVFVGNAGGSGLEIDLWQPMQNNQTLHGVFMGPLFERPAVHQTIDELLKSVARKRFKVPIDRTFRLRDAALAHDHAETAKPLGRVVMLT